MRKLIYRLPKFKGKQRLLIILDRLFKPNVILCRHNIYIEGNYSSVQDCAFLRPESENLELESLLLQLKEDAVFIDIGANCGFYSALAAKMLSTEGVVISIEPSLREYRRLIQAMSRNSHICTWVPINQAVGNKTGIAKLEINTSHSGTNHVIPISSIDGQYCLLSKVDDLVAMFLSSKKKIDLVKIDVEGYELEVLKGMENLFNERKVIEIQVEITDTFLKRAGASKRELYDYMGRNNYYPTLDSSEWQYNEIFKLK